MATRKRWLLLALPTIVTGGILIVLLNWHIPTRIKIALKTNRVVFKVGGENKSMVLESVGLRSIIIERFESVKLRPENLTRVSRGKDSRVAGPQSSPSVPVRIKERPITITANAGTSQSNVTFKITEGRGLLSMDSVSAKTASEVTIENTGDPDDLIIRVDGQQTSGNITTAGPVTLALNQCQVAGLTDNVDRDEPLTMEAKLLKDSSIEFSGQQDSVILTVTVPKEKATNLFPQGSIPVTAIKFERLEGETGQVISSLAKNTTCEITYPEYEGKIEKVTTSSPDFLSLNKLESFQIEEITSDWEQKAISITLQGIADKVTTGSSDYVRDRRLTVYDALWNNYKAIALFAGLCWVAGTTAALYKLLKG